MLAGIAEISIDQHHPLAELREQHRQVGGDQAAAFAAAGAGDGQADARSALRRTPQQQLRAQAAQGFHERVAGPERGQYLG